MSINEIVRRVCIAITVKINYLGNLLTAISSSSVNIDTGRGFSSFVLVCSIVLLVWKLVWKRGLVAVTEDKESTDALVGFLRNDEHRGNPDESNRLKIIGCNKGSFSLLASPL